MVFNHLIGVRFPVGPPKNQNLRFYLFNLDFFANPTTVARNKKIIIALFVVKKLPEVLIGKISIKKT